MFCEVLLYIIVLESRSLLFLLLLLIFMLVGQLKQTKSKRVST